MAAGIAWAAMVAATALGATGCGSGGDDTAPAPTDATPAAREQAPAGGERGARQLLARLRGGGAVIVFRHAATDRSIEDQEPVDLDDCATQRNLDDAGRADAATIGRAFRDLRFPVGAVWASPYCRSRHTGELAFGRARVVPGLERLYPERDHAADRRLNRLIRERAPAPGDPNLVIASHAVYPSALSPAASLEEGEAAVYARCGRRFVLLGEVAPDAWSRLGDGPDVEGPVATVTDETLAGVVAIAPDGRQVTGAGFRVAVDRMVVTNAHVVGDARSVSVVLRDGSRRRARVVGRDARVDIAALELERDAGLAPLHSGDGLERLRVGDPVYALGASAVAAAGALRSRGRQVALGRTGAARALQLDAAIARTDSGGPLIDPRGQVVGVTTAIARPSAGCLPTAGFAIPVDVAHSAALALVEND